ncbi:MAG TPA: peptidylprolyl isomerase [Solirubrobacteraceae bacterium]|nr:peptidylprolyl isomerase [Solirubrobacteraceae bacterium]
MRRLLPALLLVLALALAACGDDDGGGSSDSAATGTETSAETTSGDEAAEAETGCKEVPPAEARADGDLKKPTEKLDASKTYTAVIETNCGTIEFELDVKRAPKTAASFAYLAREGFFDGLGFHRIVPGFVIQGGDPLGTGMGGAGYQVEEAPPEDLRYERGVVAMAKGGAEPAGTSGSQFFIVTGDDAGLPPDYALVGKVTKGDDVVDTIASVPTDPSTEQPTAPVVMSKVTIRES